MQYEVLGGVADAKVVLGQLGFGGIEGHLVTGEPAFVADHGGCVDHRASEVEVDIARQGACVVLQISLDFAFKKSIKKLLMKENRERMDSTCLMVSFESIGASRAHTRLGPSCRAEGGVEGQLQALHELVLYVDRGRDVVIRVPLLGEGDAVLLELVLRLQVAGDFSAVVVVCGRRVELYPIVRLGLDLQLHEAEVVSLAEHIAAALAEVSVLWGSHFFESSLEQQKDVRTTQNIGI